MKTPHSLIPEQKKISNMEKFIFQSRSILQSLTKDAPVITMHWHEEAELTLITKGSCVYQIDLIEYEASKGYPVLFLHCFCIQSA